MGRVKNPAPLAVPATAEPAATRLLRLCIAAITNSAAACAACRKRPLPSARRPVPGSARLTGGGVFIRLRDR